MSQFKSLKEIYTALIEGKTIEKKHGIKVHINSHGCLVNYNNDSVCFYFDDPSQWSEYKEPQWYDNIPEEGVICWVSDYVKENKDSVRLITKYTQSIGFFSSSTLWKYATPVKPEECYQGAK